MNFAPIAKSGFWLGQMSGYALNAERNELQMAKIDGEKRSGKMDNDLISRQAAIYALMEILDRPNHAEFLYTDEICKALEALPSAQPEIVRCKECRWWDKKDGSPVGYCHAAKHGYYSGHWEIEIYRTYKEDFYCADGEREGKK